MQRGNQPVTDAVQFAASVARTGRSPTVLEPKGLALSDIGEGTYAISQGTGRLVALIHGVGLDHAMWDPTAAVAERLDAFLREPA